MLNCCKFNKSNNYVIPKVENEGKRFKLLVQKLYWDQTVIIRVDNQDNQSKIFCDSTALVIMLLKLIL